MSFKDKHALETLPKTIAALQAEAHALQTKLNDPSFYTRDRAGFDAVTMALGMIQKKITAAEEQWLELEMLREQLIG
jgi:ATP-binding cassette subfamily F protein uup